MARWSDSFPLKQYVLQISGLQVPGVYEIGAVRSGVFYPRYIGMSRRSIYRRLYCHYNGIGSRLIAEYQQERERDNLWVHAIRTSDPVAMEARLIGRFGIRAGSMYVWNRRFEFVPDAVPGAEPAAIMRVS